MGTETGWDGTIPPSCIRDRKQVQGLLHRFNPGLCATRLSLTLTLRASPC
jgi:hypothetical protein